MDSSVLTYHDWQQIITGSEINLNTITENKENNDESNETVLSNDAMSKVRKLCRICSSNGLISIHTTLQKCNLKVSSTEAWDVPISQIIQNISGEKVSKDDFLPQFICAHCLGYLQHAYEIRLKIISTAASLRTAQEIAKSDSVYLEETLIDQRRITKREIEETDEENNEDIHLYEQFKGANIKINQASTKPVIRAIEYKCEWCQKRVMSKKSLYDHKDLCENIIILTLYKQLQDIIKTKEFNRLTTYEFILQAIKLVFSAHKRLWKIVLAKNIDVDAITDEIPMQEAGQDITQVNQSPSIFKRNDRNYRSPDNNDLGYLSGGNSNFTLR